MANTVVEVSKNMGENNVSVLRRFSRRIQELGMIPRAKANRYAKRKSSKLTTKKAKLKKLERRKEIERLRKLGKIK